ncbi:hypothetical protein CFE70_000974 [Pyrenophora teres f. teres 0-1]
MELDEPYHKALDAQRNNEGQSQQANQTLPGANIETTTLQMMQQMMRQMSELIARIAKIETTSTLIPAEPTPTPAVDATPLPAMSAPPRELKGLKDPDAFDALTAGLFDHAILKSMFLNALNHELQTALAGTIFPESTTIKKMQSHIAAVLDNLWRLKLSNKRRDALL